MILVLVVVLLLCLHRRLRTQSRNAARHEGSNGLTLLVEELRPKYEFHTNVMECGTRDRFVQVKPKRLSGKRNV